MAYFGSYIRFDQMHQDPAQMPMMGADGHMTGTYIAPTVPVQAAPYIMPTQRAIYVAPRLPLQTQTSANTSAPKVPVNAAPPILEIRGIQDLIDKIGYPDVVDGHRGGIAVWSGATLKKRGYGFLRRVEILDETIASVSPVKHFSNIYIWVPMVLSLEMLYNIHSLSKDYYYDRKKELMIIRSDTLDTCVAQASLLMLYSNSKLSFYNIVNNDLLTIYYDGVKKHKTLKAMYTIVNTASK